jgi:hypothetical protein
MSILALTSDTLIGTAAAGNIEYNGQFYGTDSAASRAQMQRITQGTAVASTSGTSIDFTSFPAWVKKITVMFSGVSTNSTGVIQVQLGDSGGFEITGYAGQTWQSNTSNATLSTGFSFGTTSAATYIVHGSVVLTLIGSNLWTCFGILGRVTGADTIVTGGSKTLSDTLTQVRVIASATGSPSDTFDAGSINILYEG